MLPVHAPWSLGCEQADPVNACTGRGRAHRRLRELRHAQRAGLLWPPVRGACPLASQGPAFWGLLPLCGVRHNRNATLKENSLHASPLTQQDCLHKASDE